MAVGLPWAVAGGVLVCAGLRDHAAVSPDAHAAHRTPAPRRHAGEKIDTRRLATDHPDLSDVLPLPLPLSGVPIGTSTRRRRSGPASIYFTHTRGMQCCVCLTQIDAATPGVLSDARCCIASL